MSTLGLPSGKVVGRVLAGVLDTFDLGFEPNNEPLKGTVTFTCSADYVAVPNGTPAPAIVRMLPYTVALDELGYLTHQGNQYVMLPVPTAQTNPTSWVWIVSFDLTHEGERVTYPEFAIAVPEYNPADAAATTTDIASAPALPVSPSVWLTKGDPGRDGDSVEDVELSGTDLVFEFKRSDGTTDYKPVAIPALTVATAAAQDALNSMNAAAASKNQAGDYAAVAGAAATLATDKAEYSNTRANASAASATAAAASAAQAGEAATGSIPDGSLTGAKLAAKTITGGKIGDGEIAAIHIPVGSIPQDRLQGTGAFTNSLAAKADLVAGKVPASQLPAEAMTDFLGVVASQAAMLALTGQRGDWATRSDRGTDWQLIGEPSTSLSNWREKVYPASPVSSVAGRTGSIVLGPADITGTAVITTDTRLSDKRTSPDNTVATAQIIDNAVTSAKILDGTILPADMAITAKADGVNYDHTVTGARAVGLGDLGVDGFVFPYAVTLNAITVKFGTADASGSTVVRILKNAAQVGTDITVAAPAVTAAMAAATIPFAAGDVLTVQIVSVGTTPGNKLKVICGGYRTT